MDWAKTTAWGYKKRLSFGFWCDLYKRFYGMSHSFSLFVMAHYAIHLWCLHLCMTIFAHLFNRNILYLSSLCYPKTFTDALLKRIPKHTTGNTRCPDKASCHQGLNSQSPYLFADTHINQRFAGRTNDYLDRRTNAWRATRIYTTSMGDKLWINI